MRTNGLHLKQQITNAYIYAMLFLYPLVVGVKGYLDITETKFVFFAGVTLIWLIGLLVLSIITHSSGSFQPSAPQICILLFLIFCCISAILASSNTSVWLGNGYFNGLFTTALFVAIFLGVSAYGKPRMGYAYAIAISAVICCAVAIIQLLGKNPFGLYPNAYDYYDKGIMYSNEFLGTIGNADLFSAFLCLSVPFLIAVFVCGSQKHFFLLPVIGLLAFCLLKCTVSAGHLALAATIIISAPFMVTNCLRLKKWLLSTSVLLIALALSSCFSGSKLSDAIHLSFGVTLPALLCLTVAAVLASVVALLEKKEFRKRSLQIFFAVFGVVIVIGATVGIYLFGDRFSGTIYELNQVMHGNIQDGFGSSRILIWRESWNLVAERPLFGGGPATTNMRLDIVFSRFVEETGKTLSAKVDNAHNVYLNILIETGALSLLAYLSAIGITLVKASRASEKRPLVFALGCGLLCYLIQDFFGLGLFLVAPFMWIFLALAARKEKRDG